MTGSTTPPEAAAGAAGPTGGCQCGAVRYRLAAPVGYPHVCHCRMCQKAAGNYFLPLGSVPRTALVLTRGEPAWFFSSAVVRRGFCARCGTPLFFDAPASDTVNVTLGSLDDPAAVPPVVQSGTASRLAFVPELGGLAEEPPAASDNWRAAVARDSRQHPDHDTTEWPAAPGDRP